MIDPGDANHADLFERPLGERLAQLLVAALLMHFVSGTIRLHYARLEEIVREEVKRADEDDARVIARLQTAYEHCALADRMWVL